MTEAVLAGLGAISGGLGVMVLGLLRRNGGGASEALLEAMDRKMDAHHDNGADQLTELKLMRVILDERLPKGNR